MKLRNKKTGEIGWLETYYGDTDEKMIAVLDKKSEYHPYNSLADLNGEWEDYGEPEWYWYNDWTGFVARSNIQDERANYMREIGNYFETKEEAEKAAEKLKAWKRLKDDGFRFKGLTPNRKYIRYNPDEIISKYGICYDKAVQFENDLDLLFGGEER